jgi:hypothetical protein
VLNMLTIFAKFLVFVLVRCSFLQSQINLDLKELVRRVQSIRHFACLTRH